MYTNTVHMLNNYINFADAGIIKIMSQVGMGGIALLKNGTVLGKIHWYH